jgi:hypothetical protein
MRFNGTVDFVIVEKEKSGMKLIMIACANLDLSLMMMEILVNSCTMDE